MSWFNTGKNAEKSVDNEVEKIERKKEEAKKNYIRRWWMPPTRKDDDGKYATFLDGEKSPHGYDMPFTFLEHNLQLNNSWKNWFVCIDGLKNPETGKKMKCPICAAGNQPSLISAFTVIDHSEWTDRKGNVHRDEKVLFCAKTQVHKILRKAARKKEGLRGWKVEITRATSDSVNTGDVFDFEERAELADTEENQPYNYAELFKPKTEEELTKILTGDTVDADDDHVNFEDDEKELRY